MPRQPANIKAAVLYLAEITCKRPENLEEVVAWASTFIMPKLQVVHLLSDSNNFTWRLDTVPITWSACGVYDPAKCRPHGKVRPMTTVFEQVTCSSCKNSMQYMVWQSTNDGAHFGKRPKSAEEFDW